MAKICNLKCKKYFLEDEIKDSFVCGIGFALD